MNKIEYGDSLSTDIKRISIRNKKGDIVLNSVFVCLLINLPVAVTLAILAAVDISNLPTYTTNIPALGLFDLGFCVIRSIKKLINRKKAATSADERIEDLSRRIVRDDSLNTNFMPTITNKDAITESIQVENTDVSSDLDTIVTDFYSLDNKDRLLVLREVKKHIKKDPLNKSAEVSELFVLDEEDLPRELPVVRRLEVVNHEKN